LGPLSDSTPNPEDGMHGPPIAQGGCLFGGGGLTAIHVGGEGWPFPSRAIIGSVHLHPESPADPPGSPWVPTTLLPHSSLPLSHSLIRPEHPPLGVLGLPPEVGLFSLLEANPPQYKYTCTVPRRPFPRRGGGCISIWTEPFSTFATSCSAWGVRLFGALLRPGGSVLR